MRYARLVSELLREPQRCEWCQELRFLSAPIFTRDRETAPGAPS